MDILIYHHELADGDFPDCCVRCGAGDTEFVPLVLTTSIPLLGGSFEYTEVELPFCPAHVKPPLVSLNYPAVREFTEDGVIVKNVSAEFVDALEERRARRPRRQRRAEGKARVRRGPREEPPTPSAEQEAAYRRFVIGCIVAAILTGVLIGVAVVLFHR